MKTYLIKFFFGTDLRAHYQATAYNEVQALSIALVQIREACWVSGKAFRIEITLV